MILSYDYSDLINDIQEELENNTLTLNEDILLLRQTDKAKNKDKPIVCLVFLLTRQCLSCFHFL